MESEINEDDIEGIHPETLEEKTPSLISLVLSLVSGIFSVYGWLVLCGSILCFFLWKSWSPKYEKWKEAAEYHKNPDKFIDRENAVQAARHRLQQEYEEKAKERAQKLKEEQERKRAMAATMPRPSTTETKPSSDESKSKNLRTGFNPLMSDTRSGSWRAGRRSGGG